MTSSDPNYLPKPHFQVPSHGRLGFQQIRFEGTQTFTRNTWNYHSLLLDTRFPQPPLQLEMVKQSSTGQRGLMRSLLAALWERFPTKYKTPLLSSHPLPALNSYMRTWWMVLLQPSCDPEVKPTDQKVPVLKMESRKIESASILGYITKSMLQKAFLLSNSLWCVMSPV